MWRFASAITKSHPVNASGAKLVGMSEFQTQNRSPRFTLGNETDAIEYKILKYWAPMSEAELRELGDANWILRAITPGSPSQWIFTRPIKKFAENSMLTQWGADHSPAPEKP